MDAFDAAWSVLKALEEQQMRNPLAETHRKDPLTGGTMHPVIQGMLARRGMKPDDYDEDFRETTPLFDSGGADWRYKYRVSRIPERMPYKEVWEPESSVLDREQLERGSVFGDEHDYYDIERDEYYRPRHHGDEGIIDLNESGTAQRRQKGSYGIGETGPRYYSENLPDDMNYRSLMVPYLPLPHRPNDWKDIFS